MSVFAEEGRHHPPTSAGESVKAPSSSEEGVGGGVSPQAPPREVMLARAADMRRSPTEPEKLLWLALRQSRLGGHKFRRQAIIGGRIADFFCPAKGLIIEIDGETHDRQRDLRRDFAIRQQTGFTTLRFTNREVMQEREGVLQAVLLALAGSGHRWVRCGSGEKEEGRHHPLTPSSKEEGG